MVISFDMLLRPVCPKVCEYLKHVYVLSSKYKVRTGRSSSGDAMDGLGVVDALVTLVASAVVNHVDRSRCRSRPT